MTEWGILARVHALIIKLLGVKGVIWLTGCLFLWFDKLASSDWMLLSVGVGGLNVAQKHILKDKS